MKENKLFKSIKQHGFLWTLSYTFQIYLPRKLYANKKLQDIIVIQSHHDFDCNGGAIYDYLIKHGYNQKYKIVWLIRHELPKTLPENVECFKVSENSFLKTKTLAQAKYFFADDEIAKKLSKGQISVYCTHGGICFKDVRSLMNLEEYQLDYALSPSSFFDPFMFEKYHFDPSITKMLHTGYPSLDILFDETIQDEYLKLTNKTYQHKILWMPTFRKGGGVNRNDSSDEQPYGIPLIKTSEMMNELNALLVKHNILLTIKIHPSSDPASYAKLTSLSNVFVVTPAMEKEKNINKYALMKYSDALISDYSGASYEYLLLNRPIGFMVSDLKDYKIGFIVDNIYDYMPGHLIDTYEDFKTFIEMLVDELDPYLNKRTDLLNQLYQYQDGDSTKRLLEYLNITK